MNHFINRKREKPSLYREVIPSGYYGNPFGYDDDDEEPKKSEPKKSEPKKAEPEPKKPEPKKAEPEPKKPEPELKKVEVKELELELKKLELKKVEPKEPEPSEKKPVVIFNYPKNFLGADGKLKGDLYIYYRSKKEDNFIDIQQNTSLQNKRAVIKMPISSPIEFTFYIIHNGEKIWHDVNDQTGENFNITTYGKYTIEENKITTNKTSDGKKRSKSKKRKTSDGKKRSKSKKRKSKSKKRKTSDGKKKKSKKTSHGKKRMSIKRRKY